MHVFATLKISVGSKYLNIFDKMSLGRFFKDFSSRIGIMALCIIFNSETEEFFTKLSNAS